MEIPYGENTRPTCNYQVEWCFRGTQNINDNSCMDIAGEYDPPDSGFGYKKLNIIPRKPSFYK